MDQSDLQLVSTALDQALQDFKLTSVALNTYSWGSSLRALGPLCDHEFQFDREGNAAHPKMAEIKEVLALIDIKV